MPFTNFPNGLTSFGIPQMALGFSIPQPQLRAPVIFVDSVYGGDSQSGLDPSRSVKTLTQALLLAKNGSTIFIFPGTHAGSARVVTQNYLTIVGAQFAGYARPDIGAPSGAVPLTVQGQGFRTINCRFYGTASDAVVQSGNGFLYDNCVFDGDATATKAGLRYMGAVVGSDATHYTASEGIVQNSLFRGCANGIIFDTAPAPNGVGSTDNLIQYNRFYSNTLDIATADTNAGTYSVQLTDIVGNWFADKNKATYIDFTTANGGAASDQSGTVAQNGFASDTMTTTKIKAVGTGFTFMGNYNTVGIFDGSGLD